MTRPELSAILFGLFSAACWGVGDFSGGVAAKRSSVYGVVIFSQFVGAILLVGLALLLAEGLPAPGDLLLGGLAGLFGALGLVALYRGLALGRMGIVAPLTAVVSAVVPVIFGLLLEGLPAPRRLGGFGLALVAVWILSRADDKVTLRVDELGLPLIAGLGFGVFLILIDRVSDVAVLWPLVAARVASLSMLLPVAALRRSNPFPPARHLSLIALVGLFDTGGNAFFALAARFGRLDVASILSSLYPAGTVLLAWWLLKEPLTPRHGVGVASALAAVLLIA